MSFEQINRVFHFCDSQNLASFREYGGIYSREQCDALGIEIPVPGGDEASQRSDEARGTHRYVHLGFTTNHPMAYVAQRDGRLKRVVYVHIKPEVLLGPGVLFVPGLANTNGIPFYPFREAIDRGLIDFEALYKRLDFKIPAELARRQQVEKYEILVPDFISADSIVYWPNG